MAKTRAEVVEATIASIRRFYRRGQQAPPRRSLKEEHGQKAIDTKAARLGMNGDTLRKARQFAEEYTQDDMERLCQLVRKKQSGMDEDRPVFSASHIIRLLTLPAKRQREALQREAIEQAWSRRQLNDEIAKRFGPRRNAGRRPYIPVEVGAVYAHLEGFCERYRRWLEELSREDAAGEHVTLEDLPWWIRKRVAEAGALLGQVQRIVTSEMQKSWPTRELRQAFRDEAGEA